MTARARSLPQERSKELFEPLRGAPCRALKGAAQDPARCPRALEVAARASAVCPRALEVAAQAPAQCPRSVRNTFLSPYPELQRRSSQLLCLRAFEEAFKEAVQKNSARLH